MILDAYYDAVRRLLGEGDTDKQITHVGFGTDPSPPASTDTTLSPDAVTVAVSAVTYSTTDPRTVTVAFTLPLDAGNGLVIRETGLLTADGTLIARKTRDPLLKTPDMRLGESWDIQV